MMKVGKKLRKLWSRKKKRKKITYQEFYYYQPPPPPRRLPPPPPLPPPPSCHCCCSYSTPVQPTAPPLPPWLEHEQTHETISTAEEQQVGYADQIQFPSEEIVVEANASYPDTLPADQTPLLYQQYTVPDPVYGVPVVGQTHVSRKSAGLFGCFAKLGVVLIRCFCPCFHIREVHRDHRIIKQC